MAAKNASEKTSSNPIGRGLYVLRYAESDAPVPPIVYVRPSYGSEQSVQLIIPPDLSSPALSKPGEAMVLLAHEPASIQITVQGRGQGSSLDANIRIEPLHAQARDVMQPTYAQAGAVAQRSPSLAGSFELDIRLIGHVSRRGDVTVARGAWVAGPDAPAPIEGIEIDWTFPDQTLVLEYQSLARGSERWSDWMRPGQYAGTKGHALPLTGVRLRLSGPSSSSYTIDSAALFLGSAVIEQRGQSVELRSVAGHDPLVGLMVNVSRVEVTKQASAVLADSGSRQIPPASLERKGRVRVFRAGVEQQRLD